MLSGRLPGHTFSRLHVVLHTLRRSLPQRTCNNRVIRYVTYPC